MADEGAIARIVDISRVREHRRTLKNGLTVLVQGYSRSVQRSILQMEKKLNEFRRMQVDTPEERAQVNRAIRELQKAITKAKQQNDRVEKILSK